MTGLEEVELLRRAAYAADQAGDPTRQEALLRRALGLVDVRADPGLAAILHERLSQSLWSQHEQDASVEAMQEGLALLPEGEPSPSGPSCCPSWRSGACSRRASRRPRSARARRSRSRARSATGRPRRSRSNALGTAMGERGDTDAGVEHLRESLAIAREEDLPMEEGGAWINIADVLNLAGRTRGGAGGGRAGPRCRPHEPVARPRLAAARDLGLQLPARGLGRGRGARSRRRAAGTPAATFVYWQLCRAQLALARGDMALAEEAIDALARGHGGLDRAAVPRPLRRAERRAGATRR